MATISKRGELQWQAKVRRKGHVSVSRTFELKSDAEAWARKIEREMDVGEYKDRRAADKNTFGDILKRYLQDITPSKKGARNESFIIESLLREDISKVKLTALSSSLLAEWRDKRLKEVTGGTVNRTIDVISSVINVARKEWGFHIDNPVQLIRRPPKSKARERRLVGDEQQRLLDALTEKPRLENGTFNKGARNPWLRPVVEFAIETAMRRGELLGMKWEDVDLKSRVARLYDTKNGEDRDVPLSTRAVNILKNLPRSTNGPVFPLSPNALKKGFERACERASIVDLRFHDLRHEAASRIAEKLSNVLELSAVTGHKDLRMLKRYYHPKAADLAKKIG